MRRSSPPSATSEWAVPLKLRPSHDQKLGSCSTANGPAQTAQILRNATDEEWSKARQIMKDIKDLERRHSSEDEVDVLAKRWSVSRSTAWRRLKRYRLQGDMSALIPNTRGRKQGTKLLPSDVEFTIRDVARRCWKITENATCEEVALE